MSKVWYISDIIENKGTATLTDIGVEVAIMELVNVGKYFMVSGYLDLSNMLETNEITMKELLDLESGVYKSYLTCKFKGIQPDPILMITPKYFTPFDKYKLSLILNAGTGFSVPYKFLIFIYDYVTT